MTDVGQFVTLTPDDAIRFVRGENLGKLSITNKSSSKNVAFKIRTTQPLCFVVRPNAGVIEANGSAQTEIQYVPNHVSRYFSLLTFFFVHLRLWQMLKLASFRCSWLTQIWEPMRLPRSLHSSRPFRRKKCTPPKSQ